MPRLGNVRLSIKLGLCFGVILALTAAIIAVDVHNVQGLEKAHNRVTRDVVPRIIAAQSAEAAFADLHFSQTAMVLTGGKTRADEMADLAAAAKAVAALRRTDGDSGSASRVAAVSGSIDTWKVLDDKLYTAVKRGDTGFAEQTVAGYADAAADNVDHRHRAVHHRRPIATVARPTSASPRSRARPGAPRISLGALALLAALAWPSGSRATSAGACAPSRRPPRRSPRATSTTSSPSAAATRSGAPPCSGHDGRAPALAGRRRRPRGRR